MARRSQLGDPGELRRDLVAILESFEELLQRDELREKVRHLIPAYHKLRDLGASLIPVDDADSTAARYRMLLYLQRYVGEIIDGDELMVVAGIQDYPRRIRELRVEQGWSVISGKTVSKYYREGGELEDRYLAMKPSQYALLSDVQDRDAAHRWRTANDIRKTKGSAQSKLLAFFLANVGMPITGEELIYVANGTKDWQRRIRELRTEEGWPIFTRMTGDVELPVGTYVLREDRQDEVHDRHIPDKVRIAVLERDHHACCKCGWSPEDRIPGDPRAFLELHHMEHHVAGGRNTIENLLTLCNVDHDDIHRLDRNQDWRKEEIRAWLEL